MGRARNKDAGVLRASSSFGYFCASASREGVSVKSLRRLRSKTVCKDKEALQTKWYLGHVSASVGFLAAVKLRKDEHGSCKDVLFKNLRTY